MGINLGSVAIADLKVGEEQVDRICLNEEVIWQAGDHVNAVKFELINPSDTTATLTVEKVNSPYGQNFEYSLDGESWQAVALNTAIHYGPLGVLYIRGKNLTGLSWGVANYIRFVSGGESFVNCSGNIMYLLDYDQDLYSIPNSGCFTYLFRDNNKIVSTPKLPATTLDNYCYDGMFSGCTSLTVTPSLPATALKLMCYHEMFMGCTSLTTVTKLPATVLGSSCYSHMFDGCTSLTTIPEIKIQGVSSSCCVYMFRNCKKLTTTPKLSAKYLESTCYAGMFAGCTSLTIAPELPATTVHSYCYSEMFDGCTSLTTPPPTLPAQSFEFKYRCYEKMFRNCTSLTTAPSIAMTDLFQSTESFYQMFYGCKSLTTIPALSLTYAPNGNLAEMFYGCSSLIISDTKTSDAQYRWTIRALYSNSVNNSTFKNCAGTRGSDNLNLVSGQSVTYYTQNPPVEAK